MLWRASLNTNATHLTCDNIIDNGRGWEFLKIKGDESIRVIIIVEYYPEWINCYCQYSVAKSESL